MHQVSPYVHQLEAWHNYKIKRPDISAWPFIVSGSGLRTGESSEQEDREQDQQNNNRDRNI